jgi:hypothetical protein
VKKFQDFFTRTGHTTLPEGPGAEVVFCAALS